MTNLGREMTDRAQLCWHVGLDLRERSLALSTVLRTPYGSSILPLFDHEFESPYERWRGGQSRERAVAKIPAAHLRRGSARAPVHQSLLRQIATPPGR